MSNQVGYLKKTVTRAWWATSTQKRYTEQTNTDGIKPKRILELSEAAKLTELRHLLGVTEGQVGDGIFYLDRDNAELDEHFDMNDLRMCRTGRNPDVPVAGPKYEHKTITAIQLALNEMTKPSPGAKLGMQWTTAFLGGRCKVYY